MFIRKFSLQLVREAATAAEYVTKINTPVDVQTFINNVIGNKADEHFIVVHLNIKHEPIGYMEIAHGTLSETLIHPREVFKGSLLNNAHAIICAHNHPSGSGPVTPSAEDASTTKALIAAGKLLGVKLIDHVIVSHGSTYSFREQLPSLWDND